MCPNTAIVTQISTYSQDVSQNESFCIINLIQRALRGAQSNSCTRITPENLSVLFRQGPCRLFGNFILCGTLVASSCNLLLHCQYLCECVTVLHVELPQLGPQNTSINEELMYVFMTGYCENQKDSETTMKKYLVEKTTI